MYVVNKRMCDMRLVLTGKFVDEDVEFEFPRVGEVFCDFCSWE